MTQDAAFVRPEPLTDEERLDWLDEWHLWEAERRDLSPAAHALMAAEIRAAL